MSALNEKKSSSFEVKFSATRAYLTNRYPKEIRTKKTSILECDSEEDAIFQYKTLDSLKHSNVLNIIALENGGHKNGICVEHYGTTLSQMIHDQTHFWRTDKQQRIVGITKPFREFIKAILQVGEYLSTRGVCLTESHILDNIGIPHDVLGHPLVLKVSRDGPGLIAVTGVQVAQAILKIILLHYKGCIVIPFVFQHFLLEFDIGYAPNVNKIDIMLDHPLLKRSKDMREMAEDFYEDFKGDRLHYPEYFSQYPTVPGNWRSIVLQEPNADFSGRVRDLHYDNGIGGLLKYVTESFQQLNENKPRKIKKKTYKGGEVVEVLQRMFPSLWTHFFCYIHYNSRIPNAHCNPNRLRAIENVL